LTELLINIEIVTSTTTSRSIATQSQSNKLLILFTKRKKENIYLVISKLSVFYFKNYSKNDSNLKFEIKMIISNIKHLLTLHFNIPIISTPNRKYKKKEKVVLDDLNILFHYNT
jgi:formyltetrahydrofolate hydrolase